MASDNCSALAETVDHALWIGTDDGLLRWQDHRLTVFDLGATNQTQRNVRYLSATRDGGLWIATFDGLYFLRDGKVARYSTADGLQSDNIFSVAEDLEGRVWVGAELLWGHGGLQRREAGAKRFVLVPGQGTSPELKPTCFLPDAKGGMWWGNAQGLHHFSDWAMQDYHMADGLSGEVVVHEGHPGRSGLHRVIDGHVEEIAPPENGVKHDLGSRLSQLAVLGELANRSLDTEADARPHLGKPRQTTGGDFSGAR